MNELVLDGALTVEEAEERDYHEALVDSVKSGIQTLAVSGDASLKVLCDKRLYRTTHKNFEEYCQERFGFSRIQAHRRISFASLLENMGVVSNQQLTEESSKVGALLPRGNIAPTNDGALPATERQARPLTTLETPELQIEAWKQAKEDTGKEQPSGREVARTVKAIKEKSTVKEDDLTDKEIERIEIVKAGGTIVANQHTEKHFIKWATQEGLYEKIDRTSAFGNPFILNEDGDRDTVCDNYATYLDMKPSLIKKLPELKGKVLGCWCYPDRCHGDELISRIEELTNAS